MKSYALLLISLIAVCHAADHIQLIEETRQLAHEAAKACITQEDISLEAVEQLRNGNFLHQNVDQKSKRFINCYLEKLNFIQNGLPQENVIREKLGAIVGQEKINAVMQECSRQGSDDKLDSIFNVYTCFFKNKAVVLA